MSPSEADGNRGILYCNSPTLLSAFSPGAVLKMYLSNNFILKMPIEKVDTDFGLMKAGTRDLRSRTARNRHTSQYLGATYFVHTKLFIIQRSSVRIFYIRQCSLLLSHKISFSSVVSYSLLLIFRIILRLRMLLNSLLEFSNHFRLVAERSHE